MGLSLKKIKTLTELSNLLYSYLPGNAHPLASQDISFAGIARDIGLADFWQGGSKQPAINSLLERTLEHRSHIFCQLILEIVKRGIKYRDNKGSPVTKEELILLNGYILDIGFKIPELWDDEFLSSLPRESVEEIESSNEINKERLYELSEKLISLDNIQPPQNGFEFERLLNRLFGLFDLAPRGSFRLRGVQIDGSLDFDNHTYLIEATCQKQQVGQEDLLAFRGKVEGKATWSRGLYISVNGFTKDGLIAFSKGRPTNLITIDGQDLYFILEGQMSLSDAIRLKTRRTAETGEVMVSVQQLMLET